MVKYVGPGMGYLLLEFLAQHCLGGSSLSLSEANCSLKQSSALSGRRGYVPVLFEDAFL